MNNSNIKSYSKNSYYEDKYDFSLTKNGSKLNSGTKKKKNKKKNTTSCYNSKHIRIKMKKAVKSK